MSDTKKTHTSISQAATLDEVADYWDSYSLADHWDETEDVEIEVRAERRHRLTLAPGLYRRLEEKARQLGLVPETLANLWLAERLDGSTGKTVV